MNISNFLVMLKKLIQKSISVLVLVVAAWVVWTEFFGDGVRPNQGSSSVPLSLSQSEAMYQDLGGKPGNPPLTLFVTAWCGVCRALESQLQQLQVPYVSVDIDNNRKALLYYQRVTAGRGGAVPVTVVGTKVLVGLQTRAILKELLELVGKKDLKSDTLPQAT